MNWHIREAARHIALGGIIAYPTETIYGLGCNPFDAAAVLRLLAIKQRPLDSGLILIGNSLEDFAPFLQPLSKTVRTRVGRRGKRPVTWVLPCRPDTPYWLTGVHDTLAVRLCSHPQAKALCEARGGPLVSTSANLHGHNFATSALRVRLTFNDQLDYIVHDTGSSTGAPSVIRDGLTGRILRT